MSTVTMKKISQEANEFLAEKPELPGLITLDNSHVAMLIQHAMPQYRGLVKPTSEKLEGDSKFICIKNNARHDQDFVVPQSVEITLEESQLILYSPEIWKSIGTQIDDYLKNHPVMLAEKPPSSGVVAIDSAKAVFKPTYSRSQLSINVMFSIYFPVQSIR